MKISISKLHEILRDPDISEKELRPYFKLDEERSLPFAPVSCPNPDTVDLQGLEGDVLVGSFNWLSKRNRRRKYLKLKNDSNRIRVVSEGDSWFQYPILLDDVIDHISDSKRPQKPKFAVLSLGGAGHLLSDMIQEDEISPSIESENPAFFLISDGGNDLLGDGRLKTSLHPFDNGDPGRLPEAYLNTTFQTRLDKIKDLYHDLFRRLNSRHPNLKIIFHGYDYVFPNDQRWLGTPMKELGIEDKDLQRRIAKVLIDRLNATYQQVADSFHGIVHFINCRETNPDPVDWRNELHPTDKGFEKVAKLFLDKMDQLIVQQGVNMTSKVPLCPGECTSVDSSPDLTSEAKRRILVRRSRKFLGNTEDDIPLDSDLGRLETGLSQFFEKVHMGVDFQPARFLPEGSEKSKAVCRINTRTGRGTGFVIATRKYVMTNNHVIPDRETAETATAEFGFEEGENSVHVVLRPDLLFITNKAFDYGASLEIDI
jgi:hypothetical protein